MAILVSKVSLLPGGVIQMTEIDSDISITDAVPSAISLVGGDAAHYGTLLPVPNDSLQGVFLANPADPARPVAFIAGVSMAFVDSELRKHLRNEVLH